MGTPYIGEIRLFAGNFAPANWEFCAGQLVSISDNDALFALIGTTYGGDGQVTFALPDLRGRVPVHVGQGGGLSPYVMAQKGGQESVTLQLSQYPAHQHSVGAGTAAGTAAPAGGVLAGNSVNVYGTGATSVAMAAQAVGASSGGGQPHNNMAPSLGVNYIISLFGIFPPRN